MTGERAIEVLGIMKSQMKEFGMTARFEGLREMQETAVDVAVKSLSEIQQYRAIGTVEECREARERQKPKKAEHITYMTTLGMINGACPVCGETAHIDRVCKSDNSYCANCGQKLDWSDTP